MLAIDETDEPVNHPTPSPEEEAAFATAMQAIAMAQGRVNGAHLTQVVVYRRGDDWRLKATMINVKPALQGTRPCPSDEIWLRDSDIVVVPRSRLRVATDFIDLAFTRGLYSVFPINFNLQMTQLNGRR